MAQNKKGTSHGFPANKNSEIPAAVVIKKKKSRHPAKRSSSLSEVVVKEKKRRASRPPLFLFTLYFFYKNLYLLGITLMRRALRLRRRFRLLLFVIKGSFYAAIHKLSLLAERVSRNISIRTLAPFRRIGDTYRQQQPVIAEQKLNGKSPVSAFFPVAEAIARLVIKIVATIINYTAPVIAAFILINNINAWLDRPVALKLVYEGQDMGYVQNESVFDEATQIVRNRFIDQNTQSLSIGLPLYVIEEANADSLLDKENIANMIISASGKEIETAYGLYVNNRFLGAVTETDPILNELARIKNEGASGKPGERVDFVKSIRFTSAIYPAGSVMDTQELIDVINSNDTESESYIVQPNDTPIEIAEKNGMRYAELKELNPDIEEDLKPGYVLQTRVARPFLSVKNTYVETYIEEMPFETIEVQNATYARGYEDVTQEGVNGLRRVIAEVTAIDGREVERVVLDDSEILTHPVDKRVVVGVNDPRSIVSSNQSATDMTPSGSVSQGFIWPTAGGTATTYRNHTGNGVDIAPGGAGHPIYAAASGVVALVKSGYTGYGHYIIIDHGNGYQTLYAHNSANYVSVGERVEQGQVIAAMGRTGWATGNHLHFEIRYNGRFMNPVNFIGRSGW